MKKQSASLLSVILFILGVACKKQALNNDPQPETPIENTSKKKLLPVELKSTSTTLKLEYKAGTAMLTRIVHSDKSQVLITYAAKYYRVEQFRNDAVYHYADFLLTDGKASKLHSFDSFGNVDVPAGHSVFQYSPDGQLINIKNYNVANEFIQERKLSYSAAGNLASIESVDKQNKSSLSEYTCDTKNSIFKNVVYSRILFLELPYNFFCPDANNWLSYKNKLDPAKNIAYSYEYNAQDYPSKITIDGPNGKETFSISYQELSQ